MNRGGGVIGVRGGGLVHRADGVIEAKWWWGCFAQKGMQLHWW